MVPINPICPGCGAPLQSHSPTELGYRQRPDQPVCQRCFRLKHYGDTDRFEQSNVSLAQILREVRAIAGTLVVLIDLVNFDPQMLDVLDEQLFDRPVVLVFTKRDLLPVTLSQYKIAQMVRRHLKGRRLRVLESMTVSVRDRASIADLSEYLAELNDDILIAGMVNAGKSSLINALLGTEQLTVSPHAHTTLGVQALPFRGKTIYDTPGFHIVSAVEGLSVQDAAPYSITTPIKPVTFQITSEQTFILGDLAAVRIVPVDSGSVTVYASTRCPMHRSGPRAEAYLEEHHSDLANLESLTLGEDLDEAWDVVITGLGWVSLKGRFTSVSVLSQHPECCSLRKALL